MAGNFEKLQCWQTCDDLNDFLRFNLLVVLPKSERYDLYSQILRASRPTTAYIVEGWGRYHYKDNIRFLMNARGYLAKILDHSLEAKAWRYISDGALLEVRTKTNSRIRLLNGYLKYLEKLNDQTERA